MEVFMAVNVNARKEKVMTINRLRLQISRPSVEFHASGRLAKSAC
jgi:hypothetical protein